MRIAHDYAYRISFYVSTSRIPRGRLQRKTNTSEPCKTLIVSVLRMVYEWQKKGVVTLAKAIQSVIVTVWNYKMLPLAVALLAVFSMHTDLSLLRPWYSNSFVSSNTYMTCNLYSVSSHHTYIHSINFWRYIPLFPPNKYTYMFSVSVH